MSQNLKTKITEMDKYPGRKHLSESPQPPHGLGHRHAPFPRLPLRHLPPGTGAPVRGGGDEREGVLPEVRGTVEAGGGGKTFDEEGRDESGEAKVRRQMAQNLMTVGD